jgi:hypothetical protein
MRSLDRDRGDTDVLLQMPSRHGEPFACPIGVALWQEYRRRNPDGLKVPPVDLKDCTDPD